MTENINIINKKLDLRFAITVKYGVTSSLTHLMGNLRVAKGELSYGGLQAKYGNLFRDCRVDRADFGAAYRGDAGTGVWPTGHSGLDLADFLDRPDGDRQTRIGDLLHQSPDRGELPHGFVDI